MDLVISAKHTSRASRGDGQRCPTYRALRDAGFEGVYVDNTYVTVDGKNYKMPKTLTKAINEFDDGKAFKLGTYRIAGLELPKAESKKSK